MKRLLNNVLLSAVLGVAISTSTAFAQTATGSLNCVVETTKNLVYGFGKMEKVRGSSEAVLVPLVLDLYVPKTCNGVPVKSAPVVGFIHGGGFIHGSKDSFANLATDISKRYGFVTYSIDYRLDSNNGGPRPILESTSQSLLRGNMFFYPRKRGVLAAVEDTIKANNFIASRAGQINADMKRHGLFGYSAGAITALHVAGSADSWKLGPQNIKAVVEVSGMMDNEKLLDANDLTNLLIVHGEEDNVVFFSNAPEIRKQAVDVGITTQLIKMPGGHDHDWFNDVVPGTDITLNNKFGDFFTKAFNDLP